MKATAICVTPEHIKQGKRDACVGCPVELGVREVTGQRWLVGTTTMTLGTRDVPLPKAVSSWIRNWDAGKRCRPITFEVEL
jgi:hypothetical protein